MHHQVYYCLLCEWIRRTGYPDFLKIGYGDELPDDLAENMAVMLQSTVSGIILQK